MKGDILWIDEGMPPQQWLGVEHQGRGKGRPLADILSSKCDKEKTTPLRKARKCMKCQASIGSQSGRI